MVEPGDAELATMVAGGSRHAFDLLYLRHAGAVRRVGVAILSSPEAAEDLVQETFLELWRHRGRYSSERAPVRAWLLVIARTRAIDVMRARARHARRVDAAREGAHIAIHPPDPLDETLSRDEVARLHAALAGLPSAQRQTMVLAYGGGLTNEEVARRTGVPLGTVKSRLRMGQKRIAACLEPERVAGAPSAA